MIDRFMIEATKMCQFRSHSTTWCIRPPPRSRNVWVNKRSDFQVSVYVWLDGIVLDVSLVVTCCSPCTAFMTSVQERWDSAELSAKARVGDLCIDEMIDLPLQDPVCAGEDRNYAQISLSITS